MAPELSILARHMAGSGWSRMAWAKNPWRILWLLTQDGELRSCTLLPDQEFIAFARHPRAGTVESIAVVPALNGRDDLWLTVKRTINGTEKRFVERMEPIDLFRDAADATLAWFLDAALRYEGAPATVISGLDHLNGEIVTILADGRTHPDREVSGGSITLDRAASTVLVGLTYASIAETLEIAGGEDNSAVASRKVRVSRIGIDLMKSAGGRAGGRTVQDAIRDYAGRGPMSAPVALENIKIEVPGNGRWDEGGAVVLEQDEPFPMTVRALTTTYSLGARER